MRADTCVTRAWRAHQAEIHAFLRQRLGDADMASDLLQGVFLKALHEGRRFCTLEDPRAWLFRVARNALTDQFRRRRPHVDLPEDLTHADDSPVPVDTLADCLPVILATLSDEDRDVLKHCELAGMTQRQYADMRDLSLSAVKSRALRARKRLREALVRQCGVRFDRDTGQVCCYVPGNSV